MSTSMSGSGVLSRSSYSLVSAAHSQEASDSSESYSSFELSEDPSSPSSEDEIVWSLSESVDSQSPVYIRSQGTLSPATFSDSDNDVVVLSRPHTRVERYQSLAAPGSVEALSNTLSNLTIAKAKKTPSPSSQSSGQASPSPSVKLSRRQRAKAATEAGAASASAQASAPSSKRGKKNAAKRARKAAAAKSAPSTTSESASETDERPIVDDVSEIGDTVYDEAVQYVSEILASPAPVAHTSNLKLLHALIIELGLAPAAQVSSLSMAIDVLPRSLRAAKALLKSHVFLNVCDYLAVRHKGLDALRSVMHPSRKALANTIRGGKKMPAKQVKKTGLGVLLVTCYQ